MEASADKPGSEEARLCRGSAGTSAGPSGLAGRKVPRLAAIAGVLVKGCLLFLPLALLVFACEGARPRQEWDSRYGPLVPHESFPTDCTLCHTTDTWVPLRQDFSFDHTAETGYALEGAHVRAHCLRCHNDRGPVTAYVARGCGGCHADPHEARLGSDCTKCHGQVTWEPVGEVGKHASTRFPLSGVHLAVACDRCHAQARLGDFEGAPLECEICHQDQIARATDPDHAANGWTSDCRRCHAPLVWEDAQFRHDTFTLSGQHLSLACNACHQTGFSGTPRDCFSCHEQNYNRTRDPDHAAEGIPTMCEECHNTSTWTPATFPHTTFPLTGAHKSLDCSSCHQSGFSGTPRGCFACHSKDYDRTRNPDHAAAGFPTACKQCHNTSAWTPATFTHTKFPLTGAHRSLDCSACHASGYSGTPHACYGCHAADYQGARNPDHVANGFPTTCKICHTTSAWRPSTFDHESYFPINSGKHSGFDCAECHTTGSFSTFSCIDCHEHPKDKMDQKHRDEPGYRYDSNACYECHPRGRGED